MDKEQQQEVYSEFQNMVNMSSSALKKWLSTEESKKVGWDSGDGEAIGHKSGKKIINILEKKKTELTSADYQHMQKVNGYIKRHLAQRPSGDTDETRWSYSLKNWGHNPS